VQGTPTRGQDYTTEDLEDVEQPPPGADNIPEADLNRSMIDGTASPESSQRQRRWLFDMVEGLNPFRLFRRNQDRQASMTALNNRASNENQESAPDIYQPVYGQPDQYHSKEREGQNKLALPLAVHEPDKTERKKMEQRCNFDIDKFVITEHKAAAHFPSTKEVQRNKAKLEPFVGSRVLPNLSFGDEFRSGGQVRNVQAEDLFYGNLALASQTPHFVQQPTVNELDRRRYYESYFRNPYLLAERSLNPKGLKAFDQPSFL